MKGEQTPTGAPRLRPVDRRGRLFFAPLALLTLLTVAGAGWQLLGKRSSGVALLSEQRRAAVLGKAAADFTLRGAGGESITLSELRGQVVLLNFWATWCEPCVDEMPDLDQLQREQGQSHRFQILAVNMAESDEAVTAFRSRLGLALPLLLDHDIAVTSHLYSIRSLPSTILIDRNGFIQDMWLGRLSKSAILNRLEKVW